MLAKKLLLSAAVLSSVSIMGPVFAEEDLPTYSAENGTLTAAKVVWEFKPSSLFEVHTNIGFVTDIVLKPGETVSYIAAGDTTRWKIDQAQVNGVSHIYIKPIRDNISTNLIINTNARSYRLFLISDSSANFTPIVEFSFSKEDMAKALSKPIPISKDKQEFLDIFTTKKGNTYEAKSINRHYTVKRKGKVADDLYPLEIFDDGTRTYIKMPKTNKYDMPVLYNVDETKKLTLVNYRMKGSYMIADKVFEHARLVYSPKSSLDILANDQKDRYTNPSKMDYSMLRTMKKGVDSDAVSNS